MATKITEQSRRELETQGVSIVGDVGGLPRKRYYTPDGKEVYAIPALRTYRKIQGKKIVEEGVRDSNLDKGWLEKCPENPKPHCNGCGRWHDTQRQIDDCIARKKAFEAHWDKKAREMRVDKANGQNEEIDAINKRLDLLTNLVQKLVDKGA